MDEQLKEELLKRLDVLAAQLGTTSEYIWEVLIKQARVEAVISVVAVAFGIVLLVIGCYLGRRLAVNVKEIIEADTPALFIGHLFGGLLGVFIGLVLIRVHFHTALTAYFNPEYWALQKVLSLL